MPSRRRFNLGTASSLGSLAAPHIVKAAPSTGGILADFLPHATSGYLHALGSEGRHHPDVANNSKVPHCLLTSIDLASRRVRQTPFPLSGAHSAVGLGDGRVLCMPQQGQRCLVVDPAHKLMHVLEAPAGYQFFGHALVKPAQQDTIVLTLKRIAIPTTADHGLISIYDFNSLRLLQSVTSGGLNPHEIVAIPGTDEVCAVHYGHVSANALPRVRNVKDAKLSVFDGRTMALKREFHQHDIAAALTHLRVDDSRQAYCVMQQYVIIDDSTKSPSERLARYNAYCAEILGRPVHFEHPPSIPNGESAVPLPILKIDTVSGARETIMSSDDHHLAVQAIEVNRQTQAVVATYTLSNSLVWRAPGKPAQAIPGKGLRLEEVRGAAQIPGTPYIAVNSGSHGIVAIDTRDGSAAGYAPVEFFQAQHLYITPA